jgi:hypothetical protein
MISVQYVEAQNPGKARATPLMDFWEEIAKVSATKRKQRWGK